MLIFLGLTGPMIVWLPKLQKQFRFNEQEATRALSHPLLVQIQSNFTEMFLIMPSTKIPQMFLLC